MASGIARKVNILCLLAAIIAVLVLPLKKEIWYDETVSMKCSKGISHSTSEALAQLTTTTSTSLAQLNTASNVFTATVVDNSNSFLYNIGLHWFTDLFGNSISTYMLFSKLSSIAMVIAFFVLCGLFFGDSIFVSVAMLLLALDNTFGMSHEIRGYSMGVFFIVTAGIYFYKFTYREDKPLYLLLTGLFSVAAVLSHFLSVYIILVFLGAMLYVKRAALFSGKNLLAMLLPIVIVGTFFFFAARGLQIMSKQNETIKLAAKGFSMWEVLIRAMKYTAINFKVIFPAFFGKLPVVIVSFILLIGLYVFGVRTATNDEQKRNLNLLFILGISGSLFLSLLCFKSHHYTAIYYRYFSFGVPFCCLFTAYALFVIAGNGRVNNLVKGGLIAGFMLPAAVLFAFGQLNAAPAVKYNHIAIAKQIVQENVTKIEVPEWSDALLIQCVLPEGYKIDYVRNPLTTNFTLYKAAGAEVIPVIKNDT